MQKIKKARSCLLELLTHKIALPLILSFRNKNQAGYTMEDLLRLADDTIGKELAVYLREKGLHLVPGYLKHDCKHIILGYGMDEAGEAAMQFYFLGNRHYSVPVVMTCMFCVLLMPENWRMFSYEFRKGRNAPAFPELDPSLAVTMKTADLRDKVNYRYNYENRN